MTEDQIFAEYMEREDAMKRTLAAQDVQAICEEVGKLANMCWREVHDIVIAETLLGAG